MEERRNKAILGVAFFHYSKALLSWLSLSFPFVLIYPPHSQLHYLQSSISLHWFSFRTTQWPTTLTCQASLASCSWECLNCKESARSSSFSYIFLLCVILILVLIQVFICLLVLILFMGRWERRCCASRSSLARRRATPPASTFSWSYSEATTRSSGATISSSGATTISSGATTRSSGATIRSSPTTTAVNM